MSDYPYDSDVRQTLARLLYQALPAMYRVSDDPDMGQRGRGELKALLEILAAPLAVIRQNVEELHADLFIDSANDWVLPYLAGMVGTDLVFPDANANRLDIRGTVAWRRRKGTPTMLQDMGGDLTDQLVVTQEGWKRVQLAQDLDLLREERLVPNLRPPVIAEQASGPLDDTWHAVDVRAISARTGRYHPKHVYHWVHPTRTWPLVEGEAAEVYRQPGSDLRYSFHPLGESAALRARRVSDSDTLRTDRVPPLHYADRPGDWFGQEGRFGVYITGLLAAVPNPDESARAASVELADADAASAGLRLTLLDLDGRRLRRPVTLSVGLAPILDAGSTWTVDTAGFAPLAEVEISAQGFEVVPLAPGSLPSSPRAVLLRLAPPMGVGGRIFPGATLMIEGLGPDAGMAHSSEDLARDGFLRGGLFVTLPAGEILGERWLLLAGDGSVYDALDAALSPAAHPLDSGVRALADGQLAVTGPGAAWPTIDAASEPTFVSRVPSAPGRGPAPLHGGRVLVEVSGAMTPVPAGTRCAIAFAARTVALGTVSYAPFQRLTWEAEVSGSEVWHALDSDGAALTPAQLSARYAEIAALREASSDEIALAARFECELEGAVLCPSEVAWSSDDGDTVLIHLPQATSATLASNADWKAAPDLVFAGSPVRVGLDGSTWAADSTAVARRAYGAYAPLADPVALLRRAPRWRRLCAWKSEDWAASPPLTLPLTERRRLDVDVDHGLFSFSADEPPQSWPPDALGAQPPEVTVRYEEGSTSHVGALPAAREPVLNLRLDTPTRLVSRSGRLHDDAPASLHSLPLYRTLTEALAAIAADWAATPASALTDLGDDETIDLTEVIQIEDSVTYEDEAPVWPGLPSDPLVAARTRLSLTVQAAERERPVLVVSSWGLDSPSSPATYAAITMRGLALGGPGWTGADLPPAEAVTLQMCTLLFPENALRFGDPEAGAEVIIERCVTGGLVLQGVGTLSVADSVVDAGASAVALSAPSGSVMLDRVTVGGTVAVRVLEASEVIFNEDVTVDDRFQGCVRYSRVTSDSVLPRTYRVARDTQLRYVSTNRHDPAFRRLHERCDSAVSRGAENGSEMGAFSETHLAQRYEAFSRRLNEYTPAGLSTGIIRRD